jgi:4-diphosphocytidyl-2-C-methyl-D-erythritol kinase
MMVTVYSPAKINWFLKVLYLRDDGFHEIRSVMQKVGVYDELTFCENSELLITSDMDIPLKDNLVYKAAVAMQEAVGVGKGARIHLKKGIPTAAGLGGGSGDASTTLIGLNLLWSAELNHEQLHRLAEKLGSDVPFFLYDAMALVEGRGEKVIPCKLANRFYLLLVKPNIQISTPWAYKSLNKNKVLTKNDFDTKMLRQTIEEADVEKMSLMLVNDLEAPVIAYYPIIEQIKAKLLHNGARLALMSGSGSTVFGLFDNAKTAEKASQQFNQMWRAVAETLI